MFKLITDSTADLPVEYLEAHDVGCLPISYILDGVTYGREKQLDWKEFYACMREEGKMPTTSQINPAEAKELLEEYIQTGGTCGNIGMAARELMEEHPQVKIRVVDSLSASMGEGLFVHKAVRMRDAGKSMEETARWLEEHVLNFTHVFTVDDLYHLYRGGRVSRTAAVLGSMISIKVSNIRSSPINSSTMCLLAPILTSRTEPAISLSVFSVIMHIKSSRFRISLLSSLEERALSQVWDFLSSWRVVIICMGKGKGPSI